MFGWLFLAFCLSFAWTAQEEAGTSPLHSLLGRGRVKSQQDEDIPGILSVEWGDQGSLELEHRKKDRGEGKRQAKEGTGQLLNSIEICMLSPALDLGDTEINEAGLLVPQVHKQAQKQAYRKMAKTVEEAKFCGSICLARVCGSTRATSLAQGHGEGFPEKVTQELGLKRLLGVCQLEIVELSFNSIIPSY